MRSTSRRRALALAGAAVAFALAGCGGTPRPVLVFAAASLEQAISEVGAAFAGRTGFGIAFNTAGSNVLARQIEAGAPADLYVSADARWVDDLLAMGLLDPETRRELLTNRLVVIAHPGSGYTLGELTDLGQLPFRHLSVGDPESVPAGRYARSLLERTYIATGTVWQAVADRVAPAPDVRAALALVAAEPDAVGIVYQSDLAAGGAGARGVEVLHRIDRETDPPIRYVAALVRRPSGETRGARELLDFLGSAEAAAIFARNGFVPLPAGE